VLGRNQPKDENKPKPARKGGKGSARKREEARLIRSRITQAEKAMSKLQGDCAALDAALIDPSTAKGAFAGLSIEDLAKRRAQLASKLEETEALWLEASEELETLG
jgi:ATP-binding cassette subfamily F protein 3